MQRKQEEGRKEEIMETDGRVVRPGAKRKHTEGRRTGRVWRRPRRGVSPHTTELICTFCRKRGGLIRLPLASPHFITIQSDEMESFYGQREPSISCIRFAKVDYYPNDLGRTSNPA